MTYPHQAHFSRTKQLAKKLKRPQIYEWLVVKGYFPESYILPPCFMVTDHPKYGKRFFCHKPKLFKPKLCEYLQVHFPQTELTDRTFGVIDPEVHSDIAYTLALNWKSLLNKVFHKDNKVCSYSFPIPLDAKNPGKIGRLRSGRMIYEFIEMAENDVASIAHNYKCLIKTDIKNFYPSVYTHSIPWALHGKSFIRKNDNRHKYSYLGNRLDKLFQNANDGCTNGIPIGPAVSDLIAELLLSEVDRLLSKSFTDDVVVVRFKDDYWILGKSELDARKVIKNLQVILKEYRLQLNDEKTEIYELPNGVFRNWVSQYHAANPNPKKYYDFKRFREVYLAVIRIDRDNPGSGVIDRFLADLITKKYRIRVKLDVKTLPKVLSLLLMLGNLRTKAFPKILAIIESILKSPFGKAHVDDIVKYLEELLKKLLSQGETDNKYLITWIAYFIRSNNLEKKLQKSYKFKDPIVRSTYTSRFTFFNSCPDFKVFLGVKQTTKTISMLEHLDVFKPQ